MDKVGDILEVPRLFDLNVEIEFTSLAKLHFADDGSLCLVEAVRPFDHPT